MDKRFLKTQTHNAVQNLTVANNDYKQWIFRFTFLELDKDLSKFGDITSNSLFPEDFDIKAKIFTKESGVISGLEELKYFLEDSSMEFKPKLKAPIKIDLKAKDGDSIKKNDVLCEIEGKATDVLSAERVSLNFLARMSGISTFTRSICDQVADYNVLITPTRKTLWGWLDKKAVTVGGGGTHRLDLSDAILIKDTHLDLLSRDISKALQMVFESDFKGRFVEIEVVNKQEAIESAEVFNMLFKNNFMTVPSVIMFDNMSANDIADALEEIKGKKLQNNLLFEASGNICFDNVKEYAKTGIDIISMGCLTGGVKSLDLSLKVTGRG